MTESNSLRAVKVRGLLDKAFRQDNGCLICHLKPNAKGYSPVGLGGRDGIKYRAHRLIWEELKGPIPFGRLICHTCDNRRCINIDHLFIGTSKDNTQDMMGKGRHKYVTHPKIKTKEQVAQMRELRASGQTLEQVASLFGVSIETVRVYTKTQFRAEELK